MTRKNPAAVIMLHALQHSDRLVETVQNLVSDILPSVKDWNCQVLLLLPEDDSRAASIRGRFNSA